MKTPSWLYDLNDWLDRLIEPLRSVEKRACRRWLKFRRAHARVDAASHFWLAHWALILVSLFTIWGFVLRVYELGYLSVWLDEAITIYAAKQTAALGYPLLESGLLYWRGLIQTYVLAGVGSVFGWSEFAMRFPTVLVGTALIPASYLMVSKVWNRRVGVAIAGFIAFNYWQIAWSRQARMYMWLELVVFAAVYFWWRFSKAPSLRGGVIATSLSVLAYTTHAAGALVLVAAALLLGLRVASRMKKRLLFVLLGVGVVSVFLAFSLLSLHEFWRHYLFRYLDWMWVAFPIVYLSLLGFFVSWRERVVALLFWVYVVVTALFLDLFAFRYLSWVLPLALVVIFGVLDRWVKRKALYSLLVIAVIVSTTVLVVPQQSVYLEPDTPQPPWREVYAALPEGVEFVDANPVIADSYGREPNGYLLNSLSGVKVNWTEDPYTGLPVSEVVGWIVVDERAAQSLNLTSLETREFQNYGDQLWRRARIYSS